MTRPTMEFGATGEHVRDVQERLVELGYFVGTVDGRFGLKLAAAIAYFQSCNSLEIDGIVGPATWAALGIAESESAGEVTITSVGGDGEHAGATVRNARAEPLALTVVFQFHGGNVVANAQDQVQADRGDTMVFVLVPAEVRARPGEYEINVGAYPQGSSDAIAWGQGRLTVEAPGTPV